MPNSCLTRATAFVVCLPALVVQAQDVTSVTVAQLDTKTLPAVTVTATMTEQDARTAPASVTVISAQELADRNAADVLDAVRGAPGITFSARQVGGRKTLALRGLEGKHTLMLIDGRRISASDDVIGHSDYQYGWLPLSALERVEIIRGPMSALYGSEALGGVVNLITKQPRDRWIASIGLAGEVALGSDTAADGARSSLYAAGPLGEKLRLAVHAEGGYRGTVAHLQDPRYSDIEGSRPRSLGLNAQWELLKGHTLEAGITDGHEKRLYDDVSVNTQTKKQTAYVNRYDIDRQQAHLSYQGQWGDWRTQLRTYRSEMNIRNSRTNGVASTRPQDMTDSVVDGHTTRRWDNHQLTLGAEWRKEELVNAGLKGGSDDVTHKALFVQDEFSLSNNVLATVGLRADHHGLFGSEVSPRAYVVWQASPTLVVKGGWGHAFKAPTLKQISPNYVGAEGPHSFLGNGSIQPETSHSFELNADWKAAEKLSLRATVFQTEVKQLITYTLLQQVGTRRVYQYDNVDAARIQGLEAGATWDITRALQWSLDSTLLHTRDKSSGKALQDRPKTSFTSRLAWMWGAWQTQWSAEYTGSQTSANLALPAYTVWSASIGRAWALGHGSTLHLRSGVHNIGNVHLEDKSPNFGYAEQGRRLFVNARLDF